MVKDHETRDTINCPAYYRKGLHSDNNNNWRNERRKYRRNEQSSDYDEYRSCSSSEFEDSSGKKFIQLPKGRRRPSKVSTRGRKNEANCNGIIGSITRNQKISSHRPRYDRKLVKTFRKTDKKLAKRSSSLECTCPLLSSYKNEGEKFGRSSKHRSKSVGAKELSSRIKRGANKNDRSKTKLNGTRNCNVKPRKTERRYSRRDVKKSDGVTEVTSLEIIKSCSHEALPSSNDHEQLENLRSTHWPSRKSTKVIFARYSRESLDENMSEKLSTSKDSSDDKICDCKEDSTNFIEDDKFDYCSSESSVNRSKSVTKRSGMFTHCPERIRGGESRGCLDPSRRLKNSTKTYEKMCNGVPEPTQTRLKYCVPCLEQRSNLDRIRTPEHEASGRVTRRMSSKKLKTRTFEVNNKYASHKSRLKEKKECPRDCHVPGDSEVENSSDNMENCMRVRNRYKREMKKADETRIRKKTVCRNTARDDVFRGNRQTRKNHRKLCKFFDSSEMRDAMNCCCFGSQLEDEGGCAVDCRCPESLYPCWNENIVIPECKAPCAPEGYRKNRDTTNCLRDSERPFHPDCRKREASTITEEKCEKKNGKAGLSRIGYEEEICHDDYESESSEEVDLEGNCVKDTVAHCESSINDDSTICLCPCEDSEFHGRKIVKPQEQSRCNGNLNLADLCPEVQPPDHWTKYGEHLSRVTNEYKTLASRLKDMQRQAETTSTKGRMRKRISRKYPSGKEFSFEVKTVNKDDDNLEEISREENCDEELCACEEGTEMDDEETAVNWQVEAPSTACKGDGHYRKTKTTRYRSSRPVTNDAFIACGRGPAESLNKRKTSIEIKKKADVVENLRSFCEKLKAIDRECESSILSNEKKKGDIDIETESCECENVDRETRDFEIPCDEYWDACVGTNAETKPRRHNTENVSPKIVKPCGTSKKTNLKKIFIYPPKGENGPPLTLLKNSSDMDCKLVGNFDSGFRYKVTYTQKFVSPTWCPVQECSDDDDNEENRMTDEYG